MKTVCNQSGQRQMGGHDTQRKLIRRASYRLNIKMNRSVGSGTRPLHLLVGTLLTGGGISFVACQSGPRPVLPAGLLMGIESPLFESVLCRILLQTLLDSLQKICIAFNRFRRRGLHFVRRSGPSVFP